MTELRTFDEITAADIDAVGGKGLSLGLMASAGLPVPPGFCVTSAAFRRWRGQTLTDSHELGRSIADAYRSLGGGPVAVRSSATAEDGAVASFAGQQETFLGVQGDDQVCDAVGRCWASLDTERAVAYRKHQGVSDDGLAMAVVVQRLVPAEVAGVLFTRDPLDPEGRRMLVEASWGLGESVVSGRVTPDRFHLDRDTGAGPRTPRPRKDHANDRRRAESRSRGEAESALPGRRAAGAAGRAGPAASRRFTAAPRDVEWAWADGRFWLLQARPITAAGAAEREQVRARGNRGAGGEGRSGRHGLEPLQPGRVAARADADDVGDRAPFHVRPRRLRPDVPRPRLQAGPVRGRRRCPTTSSPAGRTATSAASSASTPAGCPTSIPSRPSRKTRKRRFTGMPRLNVARWGPSFWLTLPFRLPFLVAESVASGMKLSRMTRDVRRPLPPRGAARLRRRGGQGGGGRPRRARRAGAAGTAGTLDAADAGGLRPREPQADGAGRRS